MTGTRTVTEPAGSSAPKAESRGARPGRMMPAAALALAPNELRIGASPPCPTSPARAANAPSSGDHGDAEHPRARIRERRAGWAAEGGLRVTPRDLAILYTVGKFGVARTTDLRRLFFGSPDTANDRLRKLFVAGLLACHVPDLARDNHYALSAKGRDLLVAERGIDPAEVTMVRRLSAKTGHIVAVNEVRVHFVLACRGGGHRLAAFRDDRELARLARGQSALVPDALVELEHRRSAQRTVLSLELDLATENIGTLLDKLRRYAEAAARREAIHGALAPRVLVVLPSARRLANLAHALVARGLDGGVRLAERNALDETNVLGPAWRRPSEA